jgi:WD40 repeat protein
MGYPEFGRYLIEAEVARTNATALFRAVDPENGQVVAIKAIDARIILESAVRAAYTREIQLITAMQSIAVVPVLDFGEVDSWIYLVMPWMPGGSLQERISRGILPLDQANAILERVALALVRCHAIGIVHGNLKPSNILFDQAGQAYVTDFGMLKFAQARISEGENAVIGPPGYLSPEQALGKSERDGRSDIYMMGALLFEMLTGKKPYPDGTSLSVVLLHLAAPVPRLRDVNSSYPGRIESIIGKAMAKKPDERFETVGDLTTALFNEEDLPHLETEEMPAAFSYFMGKTEAEIAPTVKIKPPSQTRKILPRLLIFAIGTLLIALIGVLTAPWWNQALTASIYPTYYFGLVQPDESVGVAQLLQATLTVDSLRAIALAPDTPYVTATRPIIQLPTSKPPTSTASPTSDLTNTPTVTLPPAMPASTYEVVYNDRIFDLAAVFNVRLDEFLANNALRCNSILPAGQKLMIPPAYASYPPTFFQEINQFTMEALTLLEIPDCMTDISALKFSPDGKILALASKKDIFLWLVEGWKPLLRLSGHTGNINSLDFSPDGKLIVSGSDDTSIRIWDVVTGENEKIIRNHTNQVTSVMVSPDGAHIASGSRDNSAQIFDLEGNELHRFTGYAVYSVAFSPNGNWLALGQVDKVRIFAMDNFQGRPVLEFNSSVVVRYLNFSPDNSLLASNADLWHLEENRLIYHLAETAHQVQFTNDGQTLMLGGRSIRVSNGLTIQTLDYFYPPDNRTANDWDRIDVSPDGGMLAWGTKEGVYIWGFTEPYSVEEYASEEIYTVSNDDTLYNIANDSEITLSNLLQYNSFECESPIFLGQKIVIPNSESAKQVIREFPSTRIDASTVNSLAKLFDLTRECVKSSSGLAISENSQLLVSGSALYSLERDSIIVQAETVPLRPDGTPETDLSSPLLIVSPDGKLLALRQGREVEIWDVVTGRILNKFLAQEDLVASMAFSPDGEVLATSGGANDAKIILWNTSDGTPVGTLPGYTARQLAFTRDRRLLIAIGSDSVRFWDLATQQPAYKSLTGLTGKIVLSPDTSYLAFVACKHELKPNQVCATEIVSLFRIADGVPTINLEGFAPKISDIAFSYDGQYIASAAINGVRLNKVDEIPTLAQFYTSGSLDVIQHLYFDPSGQFILTIDERHKGRFWNLITLQKDPIVTINLLIDDLFFSMDNNLLATLYNGTISLWGIP